MDFETVCLSKQVLSLVCQVRDFLNEEKSRSRHTRGFSLDNRPRSTALARGDRITTGDPVLHQIKEDVCEWEVSTIESSSDKPVKETLQQAIEVLTTAIPPAVKTLVATVKTLRDEVAQLQDEVKQASLKNRRPAGRVVPAAVPDSPLDDTEAPTENRWPSLFNARSSSRVRRLQSKVASLSNERVQLEQQLWDVQDSNKRLELLKEKMSSRIQHLEDSLEAALEVAAGKRQLQRAVESRALAIDGVVADLRKMEARIAQLTFERKELETDLEAAQRDVTLLSQQLQAVRGEPVATARLESRLRQRSQEFLDLKAIRQAHSEAYLDLQQQALAWQNRVNATQRDLQDLRQTGLKMTATSPTSSRDEEDRTEMLEALNGQLMHEMEQIESELRHAQTDIHESKLVYAQVKGAVDLGFDIQPYMVDLANEIRDLRRAIVARDRLVERLSDKQFDVAELALLQTRVDELTQTAEEKRQLEFTLDSLRVQLQHTLDKLLAELKKRPLDVTRWQKSLLKARLTISQRTMTPNKLNVTVTTQQCPPAPPPSSNLTGWND